MMTTAMCHVNYIHTVMVIMYMIESGAASICQRGLVNSGNRKSVLQADSARNYLDNRLIAYIMLLTLMKRPKASKLSRAVDPKAEALRQQGALHPKPEIVQDEAFRQGEFFDARDLVQVRYEMLRRHQVDGQAVTEVAGAFGVSRQAFYTTATAFEQMGISGLLPRRRGPKRAHKCSEEVLDFVEQWRATSPTEKDVTEAIQRRFGVSINPRSVERALTRRKKKR
jgi:transposase